MNSRGTLLAFATILLIVVGAVSIWQAKGSAASQTPIEETISVGGKGTFRVEVADTVAKRTEGLSGRAGLAAGEGMLFVFPTPGIHGFWMKDMKFSLDIIWFDSAGRLIHIAPDLAPDTYPRAFTASSSDLYVLEVSAGTAAQDGFAAGDQLEISSAR